MKLPIAPARYDQRDQDELRNALELGVTNLEAKPNKSQFSADRGDTSITINAGQDAEIQRFATVLTANRTVTLGNGSAGDKFTIVRTGLGAFTLAVGGLKTIPNSTAASVQIGHDGTAWNLVGYSLL